MKLSPNHFKPSLNRTLPLNKPLLAHKYSANTVNQLAQRPAQQLVVPQQKPTHIPNLLNAQSAQNLQIRRSSPTTTTRRTEEEQHKTIDINLNINVNTGTGSGTNQEFKLSMNQPQKPRSPVKPAINNVRPAIPVNVQRPGQQLVQQRLPQQIPAPSKGLRIPSPQRARPIIVGNNNLLPVQRPVQTPVTIVPVAPQIVTLPPPQSTVRVSNISHMTRNSRLANNNQIQVQTDPFEQYEVRSQMWRLDDVSDVPEIITCVICHQTYDVHNTNEHVRRHRRAESLYQQVPMPSRVGVSTVREPEFRPIVEPEQFIMKPSANVYIIEKVPKGGRSSFQFNSMVQLQEVSAIRPTPLVQVTQVVDIIDTPPSNGVMIGGTGHNRLMNQLARNEPTTVVTTTTFDHENLSPLQQMHQSLEQTQHNRSLRMNPHMVVIDPPPQPVVIHQQTIIDNPSMVMQPTFNVRPPPSSILDNSGVVVMPQRSNAFMEASRRSQTAIDMYPPPMSIQPQSIDHYQPAYINISQPSSHHSTRIIIQQGDNLRGSRVIIQQDGENPPPSNLFQQMVQQGNIRVVESTIGGNAMHNSGTYIPGPMMASNIPSTIPTPMGPHVIQEVHRVGPEAIITDPHNFGTNVSQSSIHHNTNSAHSSVVRPDAMIPGNTVRPLDGGSGYRPPQQVTLVTQQTLPQEHFVQDRNIGVPIPIAPSVIQTNTQIFTEQPLTIGQRLRQIDIATGGIHPLPIINLPAPIINSTYNPGLNVSNNGIPPPQFSAIHEQSFASGNSRGFVSRLQPQGNPQIQLQEKPQPTQHPQSYEYNYGRTSQDQVMLSELQTSELHKKATRENQRVRVPKNILAAWS